MSIIKAFAATLVIAVVAGGFTGSVFATDKDHDAAKRAAHASASIPLQQVVETARKEVGGKVIGIGVAAINGKNIYYKVELLTVVRTKKEILIDVKDVLIDMKTGKVAKVLAGDHGNGDNNKNEGPNSGRHPQSEGTAGVGRDEMHLRAGLTI